MKLVGFILPYQSWQDVNFKNILNGDQPLAYYKSEFWFLLQMYSILIFQPILIGFAADSMV